MKRSNRNIAITALAAICLNVSFLSSASAQLPSPPASAANNGHSLSPKAPDATPTGEGLWILLTLAFSYGIFKYIRKEENKPDDSYPGGIKIEN